MTDMDVLTDEPELDGSYCRCPICKRRTWTESGCAFECPCGYSEVEAAEAEA